MDVSEQGVKGSTCTNTGIVAKLNLNQPNRGNSHIAYVPSEGKHIWWSDLGCLFPPQNLRISGHMTYFPWKQDFCDHAISRHLCAHALVYSCRYGYSDFVLGLTTLELEHPLKDGKILEPAMCPCGREG